MNTVDWTYIATMIGNLSGIPVRVYKGSELLVYHSMVKLPKDPFLLDSEVILAASEQIGSHMTKHFYLYGIVVSDDIRLIVGPSRQTPPKDQELREMAFHLDIPQDDTADFLSGMKQITRLNHETVMQMMCFVNYLVHGEKMYWSKTLGFGENLFGLEETRAAHRISEAEPDPQSLHNSLAVEQTLMTMIRRGDVAALEAFAQNAPAIRPGVMAQEQLRQAKNTLIVTTAEACRAAIRGGMDVEEALTSSDLYIQQCELMTDLQKITQLHYEIVLYYTQQVQRIRHGNYATELVRSVATYVQQHLSETITTDQIAKHCYLSRQHLSRRFTQEAGIPLAIFVRNEKVEEAKRLLRFTDKSVSAIGLYLGFSSQGHFARVFKETTGITPGEYRKSKGV